MGNILNNKEDGENMGMYKYIKETFEKEYHERSMILRKRITEWRKQGTVARIERPTNLSRARSLGYKAKEGIYMARVAVAGARARGRTRGAAGSLQKTSLISRQESRFSARQRKRQRALSATLKSSTPTGWARTE